MGHGPVVGHSGFFSGPQSINQNESNMYNTGWAVNNAPKHNGNFENWIGRRGTVEWAPRSPDLTPMDFYFWGHLKQIVYSTRIADVDQLRQQIIRGCNLINGNSDLLDKVYGNFEHRLELCINANGEHFEHL